MQRYENQVIEIATSVESFERDIIQEAWWTFGHPLWRSPIVKWDRDSDEKEGRAENGIEGGGSAESDGRGSVAKLSVPLLLFHISPPLPVLTPKH